MAEEAVYDEPIGGRITRNGKDALDRLAREMRAAGRRGRQCAIVDILVKMAAADPLLANEVAKRLPPTKRS
jgi:hypothetical protein